MQVAVASSTQADAVVAVGEILAQMRSELGAERVSIGFLFVSSHHLASLGDIARRVWEAGIFDCLLGCAGEAVIAGGREIEAEPAMALWGARIAEATLVPFAVTFEQTPDGVVCLGLPEDLTSHPQETRGVILMGDPMGGSPQPLLDFFQDELPGVPLVGGMGFRQNRSSDCLIYNGEAYRGGVVGVLWRGEPRWRTVVSQGCRPIGEPFVITKSQGNVILELGGETPLARLQDLYPLLTSRDRELFEEGVFLGLATTEMRDEHRAGDFLITNVHGVDKDSGFIAITGTGRVGQTVQFHLRDAEAADQDLETLLKRAHRGEAPGLCGGLLFSCNGRGTRLFPEPDHDARLIQRELGPIPLAGIFAMGELGPVGGRNYLHGFTASLALFEESEGAERAK